MKRLTAFSVICLLMLTLTCTPALAADEDASCKFSFDLTIKGGSDAAAVEVQLSLSRTDSADSYFAGTISDYIQYDSALLELVEGSVVIPDSRFRYGGSFQMSNGNRQLQFSMSSNLAAGDEFPASMVIATFKFNALAGGTARLEHAKYFVDNPRAVPYVIEKVEPLDINITGSPPITHQISVTDPPGGTITSPVNSTTANEGDTVNLRITVNSGYTFTRWNVTSGGSAVPLSSSVSTQSNSFKMPAGNVEVSAALTPLAGSHTITVTDPTGGRITSPVSGSTVNEGDTVNLRITVNSGYTFSSWNVRSGGSAVTLNGSATTQSNSFTMPAANVTVSATLSSSSGTTGGSGGGGGRLSGTGTGTPPSTLNILDTEVPLGTIRFVDVPESHWAYQYIEYLASKGFVTGKTETMFAPSDPITRAEFVTILARMSGEALPASYNGPFTDVVAGSYYERAVAWGVNAGIVRGTSETAFSPNNRILRQEMATMIVRYAAYKNFNFLKYNEPIDFTDSAQIHDYAKEPVSVMQQADVINGYEDGSFRPLNNATRAEAAKMLALLHHLMNE